MDKYELEAKYNIAETCVASISLDDLKALSEDKSTDIWCSSTKLTVRLFFAVMTSPFVARYASILLARSILRPIFSPKRVILTPKSSSMDLSEALRS